jgi:hypothetical protein
VQPVSKHLRAQSPAFSSPEAFAKVYAADGSATSNDTTHSERQAAAAVDTILIRKLIASFLEITLHLERQAVATKTTILLQVDCIFFWKLNCILKGRRLQQRLRYFCKLIASAHQQSLLQFLKTEF